MNKIVCFGSACKDIFFPTKEGRVIETPNDIMSQKKIEFELGAKYKIDKRYESLGGCAANVAVGFSRLGIETDCFLTVGGDEIGAWILNELKINQVGVGFTKIEKDKKSSLSAIIVDVDSADRTIFSNKNSDDDLEIDQKGVVESDWFFIGDIHGNWKDQLEKIVELAKTQEKKIAFNPREIHIHEDASEIIKAISLCDVLFLNKDEAVEIVSKMHEDVSMDMLNDENVLLEKIAKLELEMVVVTDGKNGAWVMSEKEKFFAKALEVSALDSTGAGDAFCSGFLSAYIAGKETIDCLRWGIANSSSVVCHYGAIDGLLKKDDIENKIKNIEAKKIM